MKRFIVALMTVAFVSTVAMADDATPVATPVAKTVKKHHHKMKKAAMVTTPVAATTPAAK